MQKKKLKIQATPQPLFEEQAHLELESTSAPPLHDEEDFTPTWRLVKNGQIHLSEGQAVQTERVIDVLAGLNAPQRQVVTTTQSPLLVLAGPGSGKTRALTHRIAHLIFNEHIDPRHILAVTFTNRAAREMDERLEQLVGMHRTRDMVISTFHSLCSRILRHSAAYLLRFGLTSSFSIADDVDSERAIREVTKSMTLDGLDENQKSAASLRGLISHAKNGMLTADQMEKQAEQKGDYSQVIVAQVYRAYDRKLRQGNCLDFDDLLLFSEYLLRTDHQVRAVYQQRWQIIHVDEFQDCNLPQYKLVRLLGYGTDEQHNGLGNVCVVGDDDQMIYTWRGASAENMSRFEADFHPQTIILSQNYRSTKRIVEASQEIIRVNTERKEKQLWSDREAGPLLSLVEVDSEEDEAKYVVDTIQSLRANATISRWNQAAVLYRTNAQSRALEEACLQVGLPYSIVGNTSFYQRKEIKDLLAFLRLLSNPDDDLSLLRVVNIPPRGIGKQTLETLQEWAEARSLSLSAALDRLHECPQLNKQAKLHLSSFARLMTTIRRAIDELTLPDLLDQVVRVSGFEEMLKHSKDDQQDRWANVEEFRRVVAQFAALETQRALQACLEHVALMSGADITLQDEDEHRNGKNEPRDAITLLTLHSAKGTEFPICFLVGLEEGLLPHSRVALEEGRVGIEEERRLCYVGLSRAMDRLFLMRSTHREIFGKTVASKRSRFLDSLPAHLTQHE